MRFRQIDEGNISDHALLKPDDLCYFLYEYTSGIGWAGGSGNSLISNIKKSIAKRGQSQFEHKLRSIALCSKLLREAISPTWLRTATFVPIPPSKSKEHPLYDDRMLQICRGMAHPAQTNIDVRELVIQSVSMRAAHESPNNRHTVSELLKAYKIDEALAIPNPRSLVIIDDLLTAGVHFRAVHTVLSERFPGRPIVGMFIARRIFATPGQTDN